MSTNQEGHKDAAFYLLIEFRGDRRKYLSPKYGIRKMLPNGNTQYIASGVICKECFDKMSDELQIEELKSIHDTAREFYSRYGDVRSVHHVWPDDLIVEGQG